MARLLALHGLTGTGASFDRIRCHLPAALERDLVTPDLSGHAGHADDLPATWADCLDRLVPAEPMHLVGYSLGARLALGLLVEHPHRVLSATLIGVRPGLDRAERIERAARDEQLAEELERHGLQAFVDRWQNLPLFASQRQLEPRHLADQRRRRLGHSVAGLAWALRTLSPGRMPDYRSRLCEVERPVCLLVGEFDAGFRELAAEAQNVATNSRRHATVQVEIVAGAGHNLPLEAPAAVAAAVTATIERSLQTSLQPA